MDEKKMDEMLDNLMKEAGPKAIEEMTKEDLENLEKREFEFSEEHEKKMQEFFDTVEKESLKKGKATKQGRKTNATKVTPLRKILVIAAAVIVILALAITSVGAWRESFVKYILNIQEEYSDVKTDNKNATRAGKDCWVDEVYFGYIPADYDFKMNKKFAKKTMISFEDDNNNFIILEMEKLETLPEINTENSVIEETVIDGKDMVYSESDGLRLLSWFENGKTNVLSANEDKETLVKIAENIKFSDEKSQEQ